MKVTLRQQVDRSGKVPQVKRGRKDEWQATVEGLKYIGVGYTEQDAIWALIRANTDAFGITEVETETVHISPEGKETRKTFLWKSGQDEDKKSEA